MAAFDFLDQTHVIFDRWAPTWSRMERLMRGGVYVRSELVRFDWETKGPEAGMVSAVPTPSEGITKPGAHYAARQRQATYMNFPDLFASVTVGHLMREAPMPNFGTLGAVERENPDDEPTFGELVYFNTDGVGNDGSQWNNYWGTSLKRATATGHRWHFAEAPVVRPQTQADVLAGRRPYLVEFSPLKVTNWEFNAGQLQFAVLRVPPLTSKFENGSIVRQKRADYLLFVRRGFTLFDGDEAGITFSAGGWWRVDPDKAVIAQGLWDKTQGQIPFWPLFWERDDGADGPVDDEDVQDGETTPDGTYEAFPAMSRPAIMEIGNAAVAYYNLTSAVNFELWDGAKGMEWLRGVDHEGWELAMSKVKEGSRWIPLPVNRQLEMVPEVTTREANDAVISAFKDRLDQIRDEIRELMSFEASGTPDSSGESKKAGFGEQHAPRLARVASELEQAQNTAIMFLELRFGATAPSGSVVWPRDFELVDFGEKIDNFLDAQKTAGLTSPTATTKALVQKADEAGLIDGDEERKKIEQEYMGAHEEAQAQKEAENALLLQASAQNIKPAAPAAK